MNTESKKHHFVPQSLLKRFSINFEQKQIFVFDKKLEKSYTSSIIDTGSENKYNTIITPQGDLNLEGLYQDIDDWLPKITQKIIDNKSIKQLADNDKYLIANIIATQLKRVKIQRSTIDFINKELLETTNKLIKDLKTKKVKTDYKRLNPEEIKALAIIGSLEVEEDIKIILDKDLYLIENCTDSPFIISDSPVILHNSFKYGGKGLNEQGIEIYFPISPKYIIGICCKSISLKLNRAKNFGFLNASMDSLLLSIQSGENFKVFDKSYIEFYNQQQIINSYRFIYSNLDDFTLTKETILAIPEIKNRKSNVTVGELGKAPPPNKRLPMGDILIIYGNNDHNMLPIKVVEQDESAIKFQCKKCVLLDIVLADTPYKRIEYYKNQSIRRFIGDPEINVLNKEEDLYELTHKDKAILRIINQTIKNKNAR